MTFDHNLDRIVPIDEGQTYNVVASDNLPQPIVNLIGLEFTVGLAPHWFYPMTGVTCVDVVLDELPHVQSPGILQDKLKHLCLAEMSSWPWPHF